MDYYDFLQRKLKAIVPTGFDVPSEAINPMLFPFQKDVVAWALRLGRAAIFLECGAGKTPIQLEWAHHVSHYTGRPVLILAPLAVSGQTVREGDKFGIPVTYCRNQQQADAATTSIIITNYEMLEHFNPAAFAGIVLDESSILKNYTGVTKQAIIESFANTSYKLACTATPAPNDHLELGNHAEFLGIMPSNEMISRWFINDTMEAGGYRLKGHAAQDFWRWLTSWAVCLSKPSDLGYSDEGYQLPPLIFHDCIVGVDHSRAWAEVDKDGQPSLFLTGRTSATSMHKEKRATLDGRMQMAAEIVKSKPAESWVIWCNTNYEADDLIDLLPDAIEVRGSDSPDEKSRKLLDFSEGRERVIITKSTIAGFGMNWQHCANHIFTSVDHRFEAFYQAVRRSWRFGQARPVNAYVIYAESEGDILANLRRKQTDHEKMQKEMIKAMTATGFSLRADHRPTITTTDYDLVQGQNWQLYRGDSVHTITLIPDSSVDFSVYSPPFANLYIYSDAAEDMGNSEGYAEFFTHYTYLIREKLRITKPGRLSAVHCKDLPLYKNRDGAMGLYDFPGSIINAHEACHQCGYSQRWPGFVCPNCGHKHEARWIFHSRVTIWKDPVIEMQRTKNHGLLHKNFEARAEGCRQGMADYLLAFRKWTAAEMPDTQVKHKLIAPGPSTNGEAHSYIGANPPPYYDSDRDYSIQVWQRYASPVWFDINQTRVLNFQMARDNQDEKHICPLQLDVIERAIDLWTNPGDLVYTPFAGIGSELYTAVKMGRRAVGGELKSSYFEWAAKHLQALDEEMARPSLFDLLEIA